MGDYGGIGSIQLAEQIAVVIVGVGGCGRGAVLGLRLDGQAVIGIVGIGGGVALRAADRHLGAVAVGVVGVGGL